MVVLSLGGVQRAPLGIIASPSSADADAEADAARTEVSLGSVTVPRVAACQTDSI